jgi:hypothetical protein
MFFVLGFALAACQTGGGRDPSYGGVNDYFFSNRADPTANDPVFSEGWDIDGTGG